MAEMMPVEAGEMQRRRPLLMKQGWEIESRSAEYRQGQSLRRLPKLI